MDALSLKFAEESALRQVEDCRELDELKKLAAVLIRDHFKARSLICTLIEQSLQDMARDRCHSCPER